MNTWMEFKSNFNIYVDLKLFTQVIIASIAFASHADNILIHWARTFARVIDSWNLEAIVVTGEEPWMNDKNTIYERLYLVLDLLLLLLFYSISRRNFQN